MISIRLIRSTLRCAVVLGALAATVFSSGCATQNVVVCNGGGGRNVADCLGFRLGTPTIDGNPTEDEWRPSFRYVLGGGNGTLVPYAVVQGMTAGGFLFLSVEVKNDPTFDHEDAVVLAFDPSPNGDPANHRRIHIYPVSSVTVSGDGQQPHAVHYWKDSIYPQPWTQPGRAPDPPPPWLPPHNINNIQVAAVHSSGQNSWSVEIAIPIAAGPNGIDLPSNDDFGLYVSVLITEQMGTPPIYTLVAEESWPLNVHVGTFIENTPPANLWGNGIIGIVQNGVSISSADITTDQTPPSNIDLDKPNVFRANVRNDGLTVANNVRARFRLANWGIQPNLAAWALIPTGNNPTPLQNVPAGGGTQLFQTSPWIVPTTLRAVYAANPHQCVRVDLESVGTDTLIVNRSAMSNMEFVDTQSPFRDSAAVGTAGLRPAPGEREVEYLLREFRYHTEEAAPWTTELAGAVPIAERLWRLRAPPGPDARLEAVITPPDIAIPNERFAVRPGGPDGAVSIPVQPGNVVTLVAGGAILREGIEIGPNGTDPRVRTAAALVSAPAAAVSDRPAPEGRRRYGDRDGRDARRFPLPAKDSPEQRVGALVGSFDGFATSAFVVGRATTLMVPAGARELTLGTNDTDEGWRQQSGDGYQVEVIQTPVEGLDALTRATLPKEPPREVLVLPLGSNLPTWILCGSVRTGETVTIRDTVFDRYTRAGCFGYMVKSIGRDRPDTTAASEGRSAAAGDQATDDVAPDGAAGAEPGSEEPEP